MEKLQAHQDGGQLHRAFSVVIFNWRGEILIQQRALDKYHCPGMWVNTICSHPRDGESYLDAAHRRLLEEMGFDCDLEEKFHFIYKARFDNGLTEWELDRVFVGKYDGEVIPDPGEVHDFRWISLGDLEEEMGKTPEFFAPWFKIIMERLGVS
ncbi:MAG: isopentenyl-diphosphate Delta-isomerase [Candidatus Peribacteria bacterium]|jgi:isopentenyl-diphosphate delta-isomerase|nr:isopentenyl-diphosphate Delta-isomerase [Candidatus Peribacteria bacterium]